jgi:hypothetical protein
VVEVFLLSYDTARVHHAQGMRWVKKTRNDVDDAYAGGLKKTEEELTLAGKVAFVTTETMVLWFG